MTRLAADRDGTDEPNPTTDDYRLDAQVGFQLRRAGQRHHAIFAKGMPGGVTPRQWAALAKLHDTGPSPQNLLGRRTAMDAATIKGVVDRLRARGFVVAMQDTQDARRRAIALTAVGTDFVQGATNAAHRITKDTLAPLTPDESATLLTLLAKIS